MAKVTLDLETFKALASSTRLQVLKALDERRKTVSEMARELELNKATLHEHVQLLLATGLVKKHEDDRKWVYYSLTWQGERILHPQETTTFALLLGISVAAAGGGLVVLGRALGWWMAERQMLGQPEDSELQLAEPESSDDEAAQDGDSSGSTQAAYYEDGNGTQELAPGVGDAGDEAASTSADYEFGDGALSVLLFLTSLLIAGLAYAVRRMNRR